MNSDRNLVYTGTFEHCQWLQIFLSVLLIVTPLISGCEILERGSLNNPAEHRNQAILASDNSLGMRYVALDFIQVFVQIEDGMAGNHGISVDEPNSVFGQALVETSHLVGVPVSKGRVADGVLPVSYLIKDAVTDENLPVVIVTVYFDDVILQRRYRRHEDRLVPDSDYMIRGHDPGEMHISNDLFSMSYQQAVESLSLHLKHEHLPVSQRLPKPAERID